MGLREETTQWRECDICKNEIADGELFAAIEGLEINMHTHVDDADCAYNDDLGPDEKFNNVEEFCSFECFMTYMKSFKQSFCEDHDMPEKRKRPCAKKAK